MDNDGINNIDEVAEGTDPNVPNIPIQDIKAQITASATNVDTNTKVSLTGSAYDANNNNNNDIVVQYKWELYKPISSKASLKTTDGAVTHFIPDMPGTYTIKLFITGENNNSASDLKIITASKVYPDNELVILEESKIYIPGPISVGECALNRREEIITVPQGEVWKSIKFVYSTPKDLILLASKDEYPEIKSGYEDYCKDGKKPKFTGDFEHDYYDDGGIGRWNKTFYPGDKIFISLFSFEGFSSDYGINGDVEVMRDRDGDGVPDDKDDFPDDDTKQYDSDGDGVEDSADAFPNDPTAWEEVPQENPCTFGLSVDNHDDVLNTGETRFVSITASSPSCTWTATETLDWLSLSPISGSGSQTITVTVNANSGAERSGIVTIAGQPYTIKQMSGPAKTTVVLTNASPNTDITVGTDVRIYCTATPNLITLASGAKANLINSLGNNAITIQSNSNLFTVCRSGAVVTFQGSDGTVLKIPATASVQTISFNDRTLTLSIYNNQVMLDDQVIGAGHLPIPGETQPQEKGFIDDFSGDLSAWKLYGDWSIENDELRGHYSVSCGSKSCPQADMVLKDEHQVKGNWVAAVDVIRVQDKEHSTLYSAYAQFALYDNADKKMTINVGGGGWDSWNGTQNEIAVTWSKWNGTWFESESIKLNHSWEPNQWNTAQIEKVGTSYKVYFNGTYLHTFEDTFLKGQGKVGLHTYGTRRLDNFSLISIDTGNMDITEGLIAYYPFNGNANDESGNGNDAVENGNASLTDDQFSDANSAYRFDGNGDYLLIPSSPTLAISDAFTFASWVYLEDSGTYHSLAVQGTSFDTTGNWEIYVMKDKIQLAKNNTVHVSQSDLPVKFNSWHHVAVTFLKGKTDYYIDGSLVSSAFQGCDSFNYTTAGVKIGEREYASGGGDLQGRLDEIWIYNRALSGTEIQTLYKTTGGSD